MQIINNYMEFYMEKGELVNFRSNKWLKYVKALGNGGTGKTLLFKDEKMDMYFALKRYSYTNEDYRQEYYERFINEIKMLMRVYHPNIARAYDYYLYPSVMTGYLQMEFIDGTSINNFFSNNENYIYLEKIFLQAINTFEYLEKNNILHRDIRPQNLLIDNNNNLKLIDFGFGKEFTPRDKEKEGKSVVLNWPISEFPEELNEGQKFYDESTEIFFLGKLFEHIIKDNNLKTTFKYMPILNEMIQVRREERYSSFCDINNDISMKNFNKSILTEENKKIYNNFADCIYSKIDTLKERIKKKEVNSILEGLEKTLNDNLFEEYIQNNLELISCFTNEVKKYNKSNDIVRVKVQDFYDLLKSLSFDKQQVIIDNLYNKLSNINIEYDDDLPF